MRRMHGRPPHPVEVGGRSMRHVLVDQRAVEGVAIEHCLGSPADICHCAHCVDRVLACTQTHTHTHTHTQPSVDSGSPFSANAVQRVRERAFPHQALLCAPLKVSDPSSTPSAPSSTRFATSVASARVGRGASARTHTKTRQSEHPQTLASDAGRTLELPLHTPVADKPDWS